jgi:hypothetical protein
VFIPPNKLDTVVANRLVTTAQLTACFVDATPSASVLIKGTWLLNVTKVLNVLLFENVLFTVESRANPPVACATYKLFKTAIGAICVVDDVVVMVDVGRVVLNVLLFVNAFATVVNRA